MKRFSKKILWFFKKKWVIAIVVVVVLIVGYTTLFRKKPTYQFVTVQRGSITETVSITGNTTPEQNVSLSFGSSGTISRIYSSLGRQVEAGTVLAELSMGDLIANLHQAEANVDQQKAKLQSLQSGARPEDIALYKQKYADATLALVIAMRNSYLQTSGAILRYADTLFNNPVSVNPDIKVNTQSQTEKRNVESDRVSVGGRLNEWQVALATLNNSSDSRTLNGALDKGRDTITFISNFIDHLSFIVGSLYPSNSGLTQDAIDTYRASINTAAQSISTASSAQEDAYATWASASQTLVSEQSGSKPQDISAQQAAVEAARASVESAHAQIENARIVAPIAGIITQFDAKIGQLASPGTTLISMMSDTGYEVDAGASETDVGKISTGDKVSMTLDAFPNETFTGEVFYIAPAQTNTSGVITYQVKISFDKPDSRIKSGFTSNINIETNHKDNILVLPQYAVLQNDDGTFVETLENNKTVKHPVTLGIQDQKGNVEILSGVTEGEQVLNIGLKAQ